MNKFHLGFDKFQRYQIVEEVITTLRTKPQLRILDIGTPANYLSRFLPKDRIYTIDYQRAKSGRFIQSDALQLPFPDKAFDVAVSLDVLEHIPPRQRSRFLAEQARVADDLLIVGAPFQGAEVELAERIAWEQIKARYGIEHQFLTEHQRYGLPDLTGTVRWLERQGLSCITLPNGYLPNWLLMLLVEFHAERGKAPTALRRRVLELYNREYYPGDNREPSYRQIVVAAKEGMRLERLPERTARPTTTAGSTAPLAPAILKLFDATVSNQVGDAVKAIEQKWQEERRGAAKQRQQEQQQHHQQLKAQELAGGVQIRQLTREIERLQGRSQREADRLNREIDQLHKAYQQQLATQTQAAEQQLLTRQEQLAALEAQLATVRQAATTETDRLNAELRTLHQTYQAQLTQMEAHRTEAVAALEAHRLEQQHHVAGLRQEAQQQLDAVRHATQQQVVELQTQAAAQGEALRREIDALHLTYQQQLATQTQAAEQQLLTRQEQLAALEAQLATVRQAATTETDRLNAELRVVHEAYQTQLMQADAARADAVTALEARQREFHHQLEVVRATAATATAAQAQAALQARATLDQTHQQQVVELQTQAAAQAEALRREIDALHGAYQSQLAAQTQAAEQQLLTRQEQLAALEAQLATVRQAATTETDRLNAELRTLHQTYQQQLAAAHATATAATTAQAQAALQARATLDQTHQQQVVELQTQAAAQAEALRREIDALHGAYQQQLATLRQETQATQEQTYQAQLTQMEAHRTEAVAALEAHRLEQQHHVAGLRQEAQQQLDAVRHATQQQVVELQTQAAAQGEALRREIDALHLTYQQQLATQTQAAEQQLLTRQEQLAALEAQLATVRQAATTETDRLNAELRTLHQTYQAQLARQTDTALRDQRALQEAHDRDQRCAEATIETFRTRYEAAIQEWQCEVATLASQLAGTEQQLAERLHRVLRERTDQLESHLSIVQRDVTHRLHDTTQHNERLNRRMAEQQRTIREQQRILEAMEQRWKHLMRHPLLRWLLQKSEHRS